MAGFDEWFAQVKLRDLSYFEQSCLTHSNMQGYHQQGTDAEEKYLDAAEHFDRLEMERIMQEDPESSAFIAAQKTIRRAKALNRTQRGGMNRRKH